MFLQEKDVRHSGAGVQSRQDAGEQSRRRKGEPSKARKSGRNPGLVKVAQRAEGESQDRQLKTPGPKNPTDPAKEKCWVQSRGTSLPVTLLDAMCKALKIQKPWRDWLARSPVEVSDAAKPPRGVLIQDYNNQNPPNLKGNQWVVVGRGVGICIVKDQEEQREKMQAGGFQSAKAGKAAVAKKRPGFEKARKYVPVDRAPKSQYSSDWPSWDQKMV